MADTKRRLRSSASRKSETRRRGQDSPGASIEMSPNETENDAELPQGSRGRSRGRGRGSSREEERLEIPIAGESLPSSSPPQTKTNTKPLPASSAHQNINNPTTNNSEHGEGFIDLLQGSSSSVVTTGKRKTQRISNTGADSNQIAKSPPPDAEEGSNGSSNGGSGGGGSFVSIRKSTTIGRMKNQLSPNMQQGDPVGTGDSLKLISHLPPTIDNQPNGIAQVKSISQPSSISVSGSSIPISAVPFSQFLKSHQQRATGPSSSGNICAVNQIDNTQKQGGPSTTTASSVETTTTIGTSSKRKRKGIASNSSSGDEVPAVKEQQTERVKRRYTKRRKIQASEKSREKPEQPKEPEPPERPPYLDDLEGLIGVLLSDMLEEELSLQLRQTVESLAHHEATVLAYKFHNDVRDRVRKFLGRSPDDLTKSAGVSTPTQRSLLASPTGHQYDSEETDTEEEESIDHYSHSESLDHVDKLRKQILSDWHVVRSKFENKWDWLDIRIQHLQHELQETDMALENLRQRREQQQQQQEQQQTSPVGRIRQRVVSRLYYPPSHVKRDIQKHFTLAHALDPQPPSPSPLTPSKDTATQLNKSRKFGQSITKDDVLMSLRMNELEYLTRRRLRSPRKPSRKPNLHVSVPETIAQAARLRPPRTPASRRSSARSTPSTATPRTAAALRSRRKAASNRYHSRDYDIDDIIVPWGTLRTSSVIEQLKPKEIHTPRWNIVEDTKSPPTSTASTPAHGDLVAEVDDKMDVCTDVNDIIILGDNVADSSDEDTSDEFYCSMHFGMEYDERKRAFDFLEQSANTRKKKEVDEDEEARQREQHIPKMENIRMIFSAKRALLSHERTDGKTKNDEQSLYSTSSTMPFPSSSTPSRTPLSSPQSASKSKSSPHARKKETPRHFLLSAESYVSHPFPEPHSVRGNFEEIRRHARLQEMEKELEEQRQQRAQTRLNQETYGYYYGNIADDGNDFIIDFSDHEEFDPWHEYHDDSYHESDSDMDEYEESLRHESYSRADQDEYQQEESSWEVAQKVGPLKFVLRKKT